jgi:hypothetical protein
MTKGDSAQRERQTIVTRIPNRFVILRLPEPRSERSERDAAEDGEGSPGALFGAEAKL